MVPAPEPSGEQRRTVARREAAARKLNGRVEAAGNYGGKLAGAVEPLIAEKLEVLQSTRAFVDKLGDEKRVECPACGRLIPIKEFQTHVKAERERCAEIVETS